MSLRHLYRDLNKLGVYPDIVYGHEIISGTFETEYKSYTVIDNKYYINKVHIKLKFKHPKIEYIIK